MEGPDGEGTKSRVSLNPASERGLSGPACLLGAEGGGASVRAALRAAVIGGRVRDGRRCTCSARLPARRPPPSARTQASGTVH